MLQVRGEGDSFPFSGMPRLRYEPHANRPLRVEPNRKGQLCRCRDRRSPTRCRSRLRRPHCPKESVSRGVGTVESGEVGRGWAHTGSIVAQGGSGLRRAGRSGVPLRTGRQEAADAKRPLGRYYGSPSDRALVETAAFCQHRASDRQEERHRGTGRRRRRRRTRKPHEARA